MGHLIDDPHRLFTVLILTTCFLAGLFILLWCREIAILPAAAFAAATLLATSPLFMYWLTFPMFPAVWCWSAGIAWLLARLSGRIDAIGCIGLVLCTHSLLLTAYPQPVVYQAYILAGYALHLTSQTSRQKGGRGAALFASSAFIAITSGAILALPVYADLIHAVSQSARITPDISFFTSVLPQLHSTEAIGWFILLGTVPEILGNPVSSSFSQIYNGLSIPLVALLLVWIGLAACFKACWGWLLAALIILSLTISPSLFGIAVSHLGLNLSRSMPQGSLLLPLIVIAAYGADALLRRSPDKNWRLLISSGCFAAAVLIVFAVIFAIDRGMDIQWSAVILNAAIVALFATLIRRAQTIALTAAVIITAAGLCYPLMLRQPASAISTDSRFIQAVRTALPEDARYAVAAPGISILPPNMNAAFGLPSVHSYNSLSPRSYHRHMKILGSNLFTYGRLNTAVTPDYPSTAFWMSNIALVLAPHRLSSPELRHIGENGGVYLHRPLSRMGCCLQLDWPDGTAAPGDIEISLTEINRTPRLEAQKTYHLGDLITIDVASTQIGQTLLILSQSYHRGWRALAQTRSARIGARTVRVNGFFLGILLPPETEKVRLQFTSFVQLAWISHLFWIGALAWLAVPGLADLARTISSKFKAIEA